MKLCITEKPSVGRDIARILGATIRHEGYLEGNGYCVTWTFGHLCTLKDPADYTEAWKRWSLSSLPMIPTRFGIKVINDKGIEKQFNIICRLIEECSEIINCGDAGQEGELIQRWVMQKAGCKKPISRLWINSLTDESIREGFAHLRPNDELEPLYTAGLCRAIGDWMLGINATRLYSLKYGNRDAMLSVGRVQTPTLALVVTRQKEIENFVPTNYWELKTLYRNTLFNSTLKGFDNEESGKKIIEQIKDFPFEILKTSQKKGKESHPRLFDLTSLQVECNRKFGLSADETLKTIQSLYEKKVTTYPRVDTTYLPDDIYPKCKEILNSLKDYKNYLDPLRGSKLKKSKKAFDNTKITDHHAIIPTGQLSANLSETEKKVFDTVALRFISIFYPDCEFEQTTVEGRSNKINFRATGKIIINPGWKALYSTTEVTNDSDQGENIIMPAFQVGETGFHRPKLHKKTTTPPKLYTEGSLLKAMETAGSTIEDEDIRESLKANGIGRPSTRASIIETLYKRGYIAKVRKSLKATPAGIELIEIIREDLLKSASLTGIWERRLREIERQQYSATEFINELKNMVNKITLDVLKDNSNRKIITQTTQVKNKNTKK